MWSEHCAYKHSKKLLRRLPTEGPHVVMGPGENAGAVDVGDGLAVAFKVESHNHPSAVEPFQGAATGVGGHPARRVRDRRAADRRARLAALRRARLRALALPVRPVRCRASATTATRSAWPPWAARSTSRRPTSRTASSTRCASGIARERAPDPQRGRRAWATRSCCSARAPAATGSAGRRCSPAPSSAEDDAAKRPTVQIGDPFEEKRLLECCLELLDRGLLALAPGPGRGRAVLELVGDGVQGRGRPRHRRVAGAAARGGHGAVRDHDLGVPGADAVRGRARARLDAARGVRALGGARHRDRRGHRHAPAAGPRRRASWSATCRSRRSWTTARSTTSSPRRPPSRSTPTRRRALADDADPARPAGPARLAEHRLQALRVRAVRLDRGLAHGAPPAGGRRRGAPARARRRQRRDRRVDRRQRPARGVRPLHRRGRGGARVRRATSPASAPSRSGSPTASTSATRRSPTSPGSSRARWRDCATPASRSACRWWAATSRSTTRAARGRSTRRRRRHGRASCPTPSACRCRVRRGGPRDRAGRPVRALARGLGAREAARAPGRRAAGESTSGATPRPGRACARPCAAAGSPRPTTCPRAASPCALAECCIGGRDRRAGRPVALRGAGRRRGALFGEGPGGVVVAGPAEARRGAAGRDRARRGRAATRSRSTALVGLERGGTRAAASRARSRPRSRDRPAVARPPLAGTLCRLQGPRGRHPSRTLDPPMTEIRSTSATDLATSVASSASTRRSPTSPASPTSRCSRSSTAARSRPASRPARAATS